jgi:heme exporter protein C
MVLGGLVLVAGGLRVAAAIPGNELLLCTLVAVTWVALALVGTALVGSAGALVTGDRRMDWLGEASIEVGIAVALAVLGLGAAFAMLEWGTPWAWDPRQVSAAVMLLMFTGVYLLRTAMLDPDQRLPRAAAATVLACIDLPVVHECSRWWQAVHAHPFEVTSGASLAGDALMGARLLGLGALALAAAALGWRWISARTRGLTEAPEILPPRSPSTAADSAGPSA